MTFTVRPLITVILYLTVNEVVTKFQIEDSSPAPVLLKTLIIYQPDSLHLKKDLENVLEKLFILRHFSQAIAFFNILNVKKAYRNTHKLSGWLSG